MTQEVKFPTRRSFKYKATLRCFLFHIGSPQHFKEYRNKKVSLTILFRNPSPIKKSHLSVADIDMCVCICYFLSGMVGCVEVWRQKVIT